MMPPTPDSAPLPAGLRAGDMRCPRCEFRLRAWRHELGVAWRCTQCGGQSLNFSQFRRMIPIRGANDLWRQAAVDPAAPVCPVPCPECRREMDLVPVPFRGSEIALLICLPCQRLWLDQPPASDDDDPPALRQRRLLLSGGPGPR